MTNRNCNTWEVPEGRVIPYGHPPRTIVGKIRKVMNTLLWNVAYRSSLNGVRIWCHRMRGCHIGKGVYIGRYCFLDNMYPEYIYIYDGASINAESMLLTHFNPYETWKNLFVAEVKPIVVGRDAIVAVRCTLLPGVRVGEHAVVSNGITLEKSVDDYTMCTLKQELKTVNIKRILGVK